MVLAGAARLLLTQVSVDGSYFEDIFLGLLVFGDRARRRSLLRKSPHLPASPRGSPLAAGLVDSSFNIGGALGIAILSTVAVSRADDALRGVGEAELRATTEGFQAAFAVAAGLAAIGALLAVLCSDRARAGARPHGAPRAVRQAVQRQEHR